MKKRVLPVITLLTMILLCGFITVMAAGSMTQDGISVSINTDKENYAKDEAITVDIVITNMNSFDLKDVNVKKILPEGVKLSEGIELEETIDILYAGEQKVLTTTAIVDENFVGEDEEPSSEVMSEMESEESSSEEVTSQTPQQSESVESSSVAPVESESSNPSVIVNETNNVEIITPVMNRDEIEEEQLPLAEEVQEEESVIEQVIIQSVTAESTEIKELEEETVTEVETSTVEVTTTEQVLEEASEVVISEEEKILAETMNETENEEKHINVMLILVIGIVVIGCVIFTCKKGFSKKGLSILLCISILAPMMAQLTVNAQELSQRKTMTVKKIIYIDSKEVELQTEISYLLPDSDTDNSGSGGSEDKEKIVYADGVIVDELKDQNEYELIEGADGKHTVIIEKNEATELIKAGDAFVLPQNEQQLTNVALIAVEVRERNEHQLELICEEPSTIGSIIESIDFEGSSSYINVNDIEILTEGITIIDSTTDIATYGLSRERDTIEGSVALPDAEHKIDLVADIETPQGLTLNGEISFAIPKINAKIVGEFGLLSNVLHEVEVTVTETADVNIDVEVDTDLVEEVKPELAKKMNIEIFKIPVPLGTCGLISADLVVSLVTDFEGEAHLEFHCEQEQGIRYADNKLEPICRREEPTLDITAMASGFCGPKLAVNINLLKFCGDLGVFAQLGAGFDFDSETHVSKGNVTECSELNAYLAMSVGLNSETFWVKVIEEKLDTELSIDIMTAENSPIRKKIHWENGKIVEYCKFSGVIEGYVYNAFDNMPLANIKMKVEGEGLHPYNAYITTDENGYYCFKGLEEGSYLVREKSDEYVIFDNSLGHDNKGRYNVIVGKTVRMEDYHMVRAEGVGNIYVSDAYNGITGEKIIIQDLKDGAKYTIRQGWYNTDGDILYEANMKDWLGYHVNLPKGKYTITVSANGYLDYIENYNVEEGKTMGLDCYLIPMNDMQEDTIVMEYVQYYVPYYSKTNINAVRIIVRNDKEIDKNFVVGGKAYQYINEAGDKVIETSGLRYLSEATLYQPEEGNIYSFCIKIPTRGYYINLTQQDFINNWGDNVKVYKGGKIIKFFNIPFQQGTLTHVFDYDASKDEIIIKNKSYELQSDNQDLFEILYPGSSIVTISEDEIIEDVVVDELTSDMAIGEEESVIEETSEENADTEKSEMVTEENTKEEMSPEETTEVETVTEDLLEDELVTEETTVEESETEEIVIGESTETKDVTEENVLHTVSDEVEITESFYESNTSDGGCVADENAA